MKRFIDIENNIKKFIDDYNINYNTAPRKSSLNLTKVSWEYPSQEIPKGTEFTDMEQNTDLECDPRPTAKNLSFDDIRKVRLPPSLSYNSINSNASMVSSIFFDKWAVRKCKSDSDLAVLLNNKNYSYYWEELSNLTNKPYGSNDQFVVIHTNKKKEKRLVFAYIFLNQTLFDFVLIFFEVKDCAQLYQNLSSIRTVVQL